MRRLLGSRCLIISAGEEVSGIAGRNRPLLHAHEAVVVVVDSGPLRHADEEFEAGAVTEADCGSELVKLVCEGDAISLVDRDRLGFKALDRPLPPCIAVGAEEAGSFGRTPVEGFPPAATPGVMSASRVATTNRSTKRRMMGTSWRDGSVSPVTRRGSGSLGDRDWQPRVGVPRQWRTLRPGIGVRQEDKRSPRLEVLRL